MIGFSNCLGSGSNNLKKELIRKNKSRTNWNRNPPVSTAICFQIYVFLIDNNTILVNPLSVFVKNYKNAESSPEQKSKLAK